MSAFCVLTVGWDHSLGTVGKSLDGFGNKGQISGSFLWGKFWKNHNIYNRMLSLLSLQKPTLARTQKEMLTLLQIEYLKHYAS